MNRIDLIGRVGKDPQVREYDTIFTLATTKKYKTREGQDKEQTTWHNISCRGYAKDKAANEIHKGDLVFVSGEQLNREFDKKDGTKGVFWYVETFNVHVIRTTAKNNAPAADDFPEDFE